MSEHHENQSRYKLPAAEAQQEAAQTSDAEAEAAGIATASDELSENDLEAVSGGFRAIETRYETVTTNILKD
ncbi:hypothetical protein [Falsiroseomonas sp.]|uniref:hypothetical protein n=1 Tax=Falsiroseomonas sp. TaxID=2870721 RepID=UPI0034A3EE81